jgi:3-oxoacyl-[acyl-carrier-protein] synthase I
MSTLCIYGGGMVTALGYNAPVSLAALRAGISAIRRTVWADTDSGEPLLGAKVSLPHWWEGLGKLADLVAPAIQECLAYTDIPATNIPLLLAVPDARRQGRFARLDEDLLPEIEARLGLPHHGRSRLFAADQAGAALALACAMQWIQAGDVPRVIIAGVDSYLHQPMLDDYIERRRLMTPSNSNGFFPGEAGAAVLVGPEQQAPPGALRLLGLGMAQEPAPINSTEPFQAKGLTQAVAAALNQARCAMADVGYRLTDLSGEHYKFKEAAFVAGRLDTSARTSLMELWHPIEYLGDIGAAILPLLLQQHLHALQEGYAPGRVALIHVGSDAGLRAACVVAPLEGSA